MKRIILSVVLYLPLLVYAYDIEVDGIFYSYNQYTQTVSVTYNNTWGSQRYSGDITIPSEITYKGKTIPVTSIGERAFENCSDLLSVSLPNTIISIENQAFRNCTKLSNIVFPSSLKTIKNLAFDNCRDIKKIVIPASVTKVEDGAFLFFY